MNWGTGDAWSLSKLAADFLFDLRGKM